MIQIVAGFVFVLIPFIFVFRFQNRFAGFVSVLFSILVFETIFAVVTQALHVFTYPTVLVTHAILAIICLVVHISTSKSLAKDFGSFKNFLPRRSNWFVVIAALVIFFELFSIHYNYTGIVSDVGGLNSVTQSIYMYPYYSDEWVGVSLVDYSIRTQALPLANPLYHDAPFANPLFVFYSLIAELCVLFGLSPLTGFAALAFMSGFLICLLVYILLRVHKIETFPASVAMLCMPLLVVGTNVPGIWFIVPFLGGLTVVLLGLIFSALKKTRWMIAAYLLAFFVYPPILVFIIPAALPMFSKKIVAWILWIVFVGSAVSVLLVYLEGYFSLLQNLPGILDSALTWIVRPNLDGGIPVFVPSNVIPIPILLFSICGIAELFHRKLYSLLLPISIGIVFWFVYAMFPGTFVIDYSRIVSITAILMMVAVGFGVESVFVVLKKITHQRSMLFVETACVATFVILAFMYPSGQEWSKFVLIQDDGIDVEFFTPSAPINRYLHPDDLQLFKGIHHERFLAPQWKGLVVGVATHNYPLDSKASTITNRFIRYNDFIEQGCGQKAVLAHWFRISFVYGRTISCPGFIEIGHSGENLYLYRFSE